MSSAPPDAEAAVVRDAASRMEARIDAGVAVAIVDAEAPDADLAELIDQGLTLLEDAGAIVQANLGDCDAMGDRLEDYRQKHIDAVQRVEALYEQEHEAERKAIQPRFRARYKAAWAKIRPGVMKCRNVPKVNRVIHEIWGDDPDAG